MRSHIDPHLSQQITNDLVSHWHQRDIETLQEECDWLQDAITTEPSLRKRKLYRVRYHIRYNQLQIKLRPAYEPYELSLDAINEEIDYFYKDEPLHTLHPSPRHRFLRDRQAALVKLNTGLNEALKNFVPEVPVEKLTGEKRHPLRAGFDILKKLIDVIDDLWSVIRSAISSSAFALVGPFLTGGIGFIIHLAEAYQGMKEAWRSLKNNKIAQRKTRMAAGALTFIFGGVGTGLSIAFIVSAFITLSGAMLFPILIPAFLLSIYTTSLIKRAYIFSKIRALEKKCHEALLSHSKALHKHNNKKIGDSLYSTAQEHVEHAKQNYEHYREERLKNERQLAFNALEVAASTIVLIGTILTISALIGVATYATLGVAPLLILIGGVVLGLFCKAFERADENADFKYTRKIREFILSKIRPKHKPHPNQAPESQATAKMFSRLGINKKSQSTPLQQPKSTPLKPKLTKLHTSPVSSVKKRKNHRQSKVNTTQASHQQRIPRYI